MAEPSEIAGTPQTDAERRRFRRIATRIEGRIVFAGVDAECLVHEMSATGAIVEVMPLPAIGTEVALDVPGVLAVYTGDDLIAAGYGNLLCKLPAKSHDGTPLIVPP
uniref:PilZ domain-containing protein n=1 Tax=Parvibaculum sp. TaxID=2024848 RepID=UPI002FD8B5A0